MATAKQIREFIAEIAPLAQEAYVELGKINPSVCIGMACVESAYGTAGSCKYHSYLGVKVGSGKTALKYWDKTSVNLKTKEEYKVGQLTTIRDNFRTYRDMRQCVFNFYELLNSSVYKKVIETYYDKQMRLIKECKYMTSSHEVETVIKIIQKYNLTYYDEQVVKQNSCPRYIKGNNYTLQANMYIRESPNGHYIKEATSDAKAHMDIFPILKKGTKITCRDVQVYEGATWVKCPSGWICGIGASGKIYIS
jgi:hypothetical protein